MAYILRKEKILEIISERNKTGSLEYYIKRNSVMFTDHLALLEQENQGLQYARHTALMGDRKRHTKC
jgi:hypothetical protein